MIEGVKLKKLTVHKTASGSFREVLRKDDKLLNEFGQSAIATVNPGEIKAFHWHKKQDDVFHVVRGSAKAVLFDRRDGSKTFGKTDVFFMDENKPEVLFILRGVAHGYQALGEEPLVMLYFMNEVYNPDKPDEERIAFDSPEIGFKW